MTLRLLKQLSEVAYSENGLIVTQYNSLNSHQDCTKT